MIRRSAFVATVAILLSLLTHFLLLVFASPREVEPLVEETQNDTVALGNAFENLAEVLSEPVEPEPAPTPEPVEQTSPEPEPKLPPTSDAQIASSNPQQIRSPGVERAAEAEPDTTDPVTPEAAESPGPETSEPVDTDEAEQQSVVTPPVETVASPPEPDQVSEPVEAEPPASVSVEPEPEQFAALPVAPSPAPQAAPVPAPSAIPVIPLEQDPIETEIPVETIDPAQDEASDPEAEGETEGTELAVVSSPRPRLPNRLPAEPQSEEDRFSALVTPDSELMESPLLAYRRNGGQIKVRGYSGAFSGGISDVGAAGQGNSTATNYQGRVLAHLNSFPDVAVTAIGIARVYFEISDDGSLARASVLESSGSAEIDRAAILQLRAADPFPPPPPGAPRTIVFTFLAD